MSVWIEVDRGALEHNCRAVCELVKPARLCAVVKANGYGHGAVIAAEAFLAAGVSSLAVTAVDEAVQLRDAGLDAPLLLLASHAASDSPTVIEFDLTTTVSDLGAGQRLAALAREAGRAVKVHLLVDCGMGRDGALPAAAPATYAALCGLDGLEVEGVFTHFPNSIAADKRQTRAQLARFLSVVDQLQPRPAVVHAANSGAAVDVPESRLDQVRVGTLLYGQYPGTHVSRVLDLRNTWTMKAALVEVRELPVGATIGYGSELKLSQPRRVGTLLVGWQHGFEVTPSSALRGIRGALRALKYRPPAVTVKGVRCPVLGRISMQTCTVDVTDVPDVRVGDEALIPCRRVTADRGIRRVVVNP